MNSWDKYDWEDVTVNPIPEVPGFVAQIAYSDKFKQVMQLFRAIAASQEISERALAITSAVIEQNPAHYSVWDYRLDVVSEIGNSVFDYKQVGLTPSAESQPPIGENGEWLNQFTLENAKNYQVWNYRQHLLDLENPLWYANELVLVKMVLDDDSKNFHAWSHLKWVATKSTESKIEPFGNGRDLLEMTKEMLLSDVFNNSVWSFRFFLLKTFNGIMHCPKEMEKYGADEVHFIFQKIELAPENESSWSYLCGFLTEIAHMQRKRALERAAEIDSIRSLEFQAEFSFNGDALWEKLKEVNPIRGDYYAFRLKKMNISMY